MRLEPAVSKQLKAADKRGLDREVFVWGVLDFLKKRKVIYTYLPSPRRGLQDLSGVDVNVIVVSRTRRIVCPLQVTGANWVEEHYAEHGETPVIVVDLCLPSKERWQFVFAQILGAIMLLCLKAERQIKDFRISPNVTRIADNGIGATFTVSVSINNDIKLRQISFINKKHMYRYIPKGIVYLPYRNRLTAKTVIEISEFARKKLDL